MQAQKRTGKHTNKQASRAGNLRPFGSLTPVGRSLRLVFSSTSSFSHRQLQQIQLKMQRVILALMLASGNALAPATAPAAPKMARRQLGSALLGGAAALVATTASAYEGVYSMEIVKADDAVLDEDALRSGSVQGALNEFKSYAVGVVRLREVLNNDNQFDVGKVLKKEYDYVKVRATFNKLTPLWDEDTQRGVDRLMRGVLQDITEAEAASKYNDEGVRTPKKLTLLTAKLDKLDGSMRKLFGYCITK